MNLDALQRFNTDPLFGYLYIYKFILTDCSELICLLNPENQKPILLLSTVKSACMYDRILLSTDGTVASDRAESHALDLAAAHDAVLHVLYVVDEDVVTAYSGDEYVDGAEGPEHGLEELGEETLSDLRQRASEADTAVETTMRHGRPTETIVEYADNHDLDLLVLGTKRRPDEYRALLGSVTDRVLRLTTRPATVVKAEVID